MIAGAFAEHGIVIAFPQRDLHLHAARPLQVQMVTAANLPTGTANKPNQDQPVTKPDLIP